MNRKSLPVERHRGILEELKARGPRTAEELSQLLGGRPVAMRSHLRFLRAAGWVDFTDEHRPRGRPVRRFRLSPAADALFPKHYDFLALRLAEAIASKDGPAGLDRVFRGWQRDLARYLEPRLPSDPERRLAALAEHQSGFGFMASVEQDSGGASLVERNCPVLQVAERFPRICEFEARLFKRVLGEPVRLSSCQAKGDGVCVFRIGAVK